MSASFWNVCVIEHGIFGLVAVMNMPWGDIRTVDRQCLDLLGNYALLLVLPAWLFWMGFVYSMFLAPVMIPLYVTMWFLPQQWRPNLYSRIKATIFAVYSVLAAVVWTYVCIEVAKFNKIIV